MIRKFSLPAATLIALGLTLTPALADKGKSQGHGNSSAAHGNSGSTQGTKHGNSAASHTTDAAAVKPGKGGLASELKGLNAVKANPNALENAAPNSQVGRIAAYRDAALVTGEKAAALVAANETLATLPVPTRSLADIDAAIAALDPAAVDHAAALAALQAERTATEDYADALAVVAAADTDLTAAQEAEDAALLVASGGRTLSDQAVAYIRDVLNL